MGRRARSLGDEAENARGSSVNRKTKRTFSTRTTQVSAFTTMVLISGITVMAWHRKKHTLDRFPPSRPNRGRRIFSFKEKFGLSGSKEALPVAGQINPRHIRKVSSQRKFDRAGVPEALTTIRQDWGLVLNNFLDDSQLEHFSARKIREHFYSDINNVQTTCMLVTIKNGNVTFIERFAKNRHSRASSAKYIVQKIVDEKGRSLPGVTFLVMLSDGHRPQVPTFGSARHWKSWKMMIPVPLGNSRGQTVEWGTPFKGWDSYIDNTIASSHANYSWNDKYEKALFRGSLCMQTYKLGSCNEENGGRCIRAKKWNEVNRGVLYEKAMKEPDLFDVIFTQNKPKLPGPAGQFDGAPQIGKPMKFQDFQKFKYILNVGSNQDWAERLRSLLFMNSAVIIHQAETQEFFTPLMKPWVHFIPTSLHFDDLVKTLCGPEITTNSHSRLSEIKTLLQTGTSPNEQCSSTGR